MSPLKHTTLAASPEYYDQVISLCERAFEYKDGQSYAVDFAPLMSVMNHGHNHVFLTEKNELVGHIGVKQREIAFNNKVARFALLGGISIVPKHQRQGHLQQMMEEVISKYKTKCALFLLWSDLTELYKKFNFFEAGMVYQYSLNDSPVNIFETKKLKEFSPKDFELIKKLYHKNLSSHLSFQRNELDWEVIREIESADWYLDAQRMEYFVANKGRDLENVVYEHNISDLSKLRLLNSQFTIWSPKKLELSNESLLYTAFFRCANPEKAKDFFNSIANQSFQIEQIIDDQVWLNASGQTYKLPLREFTQGIWGPESIEELSRQVLALYVSGLDSI